MKSIIVLFALSVSPNLFAADTFACKVSKKIVFSDNCIVCTQRNGDNDCVKEEMTKCFSQKEIDTGVEDIALHPSTTELYLAKNNGDISFIFGMSPSGYSTRITSTVEHAEATFQSTNTLDPWHDSFELSAKTNKSSSIVGNVTEVILKCGAL
ncbi:MAG: hypothetical protein K2Q18_11950 [Bdellovibrionales bacterium]|nr:hypothetical protein [Bdellovibrionales bacterium]